jgi:hypothetical protein
VVVEVIELAGRTLMWWSINMFEIASAFMVIEMIESAFVTFMVGEMWFCTFRRGRASVVCGVWFLAFGTFMVLKMIE